MFIHNRYLQINAASSDQVRAHAENIPAFLQNKPKNVVEFCFKRWREVEEINYSNVDDISSGVYFVKSQTHQDKVYEVNISANHVCLPQCDCPDWRIIIFPVNIFLQYLTLKLLVVGNLFLDNPFINLDIGQSNNCLSAQPEDATNATEENSNESHPHKTQQINISAIKRQRNLVGSALRQLTDIKIENGNGECVKEKTTRP